MIVSATNATLSSINDESDPSHATFCGNVISCSCANRLTASKGRVTRTPAERASNTPTITATMGSFISPY